MLLDEVSYVHKANLINHTIVLANPDVSLSGLAADFSFVYSTRPESTDIPVEGSRDALASGIVSLRYLSRGIARSTFRLDQQARRRQLSR